MRATSNHTHLSIIFHWGLYSVPAFDDVVSAERRKIQNGAEWYLKRLKGPASRRQNDETQFYHKTKYGDTLYSDFQHQFQPEKWDPNVWMSLAKSCGAQTVIITSKHHDGFCLWPTKTTTYHSGRDIIEDFKQAARDHGLGFGIYYSWWEFENNPNARYCHRTITPQVKELCNKYNPDLWWFDGDWPFKSGVTNRAIDECLNYIKKTNPMAQINDRVGGSNSIQKMKKNPNWLSKYSTFRVYGDRALPEKIPNVPWEHINTIGLSWGHNKQQLKRHYKTGAQLAELYKNVCALNGRFCINLGPDADGSLDPFEVDSLESMAKTIFPKENREEETK
jgi:alpha-L-fucosidase